MDNTKGTYRYPGAIHIHTLHSDGTGDIETITKSAEKADLSWIIVTDHNNFDVREGIINGIYVIKGEEISPDYGNHYIALGISELIHHSDNCSENIDAVKSKGGFGFSAHPDESEVRNNPHHPLKWTDKNIIPDGVEIWNWFSQWGDNYDSRNIFGIIYSYLFAKNLVKKPYKTTLEWWDKLNQNNFTVVPAIGGTDAHALKVTKFLIPVTIFPYKYSFGTIVNQIHTDKPLSNDFKQAKEQILNAVKSGNNIVANLSACKDIPKIYISNNEKTAQSGEIIKLDSDTYINIECKKKTKITVVKDGIQINTINTKELKLKLTQCGKYRVETEINGRGFAYSNPINVT